MMRLSTIRGLRRFATRLGIAALLAGLLAGAAAGAGLAADDADLSRPGADGAATPVRIDMYLADLYEISGPDQTFLADVVLRAEWLDPRLAGRWPTLHGVALDDIWNPSLQLANQRGVTAFLPQRAQVDPSGRVTYRQRWYGRFGAHMDLQEFPRDRQQFYVQVVSLGHPRDEVDLVVDSTDSGAGRAAVLTLPDWDVGPATMAAADYAFAPGVAPLAGAQLAWEARRFVGYYAVQVILPLVFIVLMGWAAFWVDPTVVPTRITVAMTTMLTLIAYRFALGKSVPTLTYLTRFDYFMLASTTLIFFILLVVAISAYLIRVGKTPLVHDIDRWARPLFPVIFAVLFVLAWWG